jgi:hypothetical protein
MDKNNKRKIIEKDLEFLKFHDIKLLEAEELKKLTHNELKQYLCRLNRWDSCLKTQLEFEKYKTKTLLLNSNLLVKDINQNMNEIKFDPQFEDKFKAKKLIKLEIDFKEMVRELGLENEKFFGLFDNKSVCVLFRFKFFV